MNTTLTTFDGYPRDDIDVAQIRTTRARIIRLRNDHKALMSKIEIGLHQRHAEYQASQQQQQQPPPLAPPVLPPSSSHASATTSSAARNAAGGEEGLVETPFARVNSVVPGSPADEAGLKAGDRIRRVGDVNWVNHEKLAKVAEVVSRLQGRRVLVKVARRLDGEGGTEELELGLVPRANWGGRGLLGCHLLPL